MSMFSDSILGNGVSVFYDVGNPMVQKEIRALNSMQEDTEIERVGDISQDLITSVMNQDEGAGRYISAMDAARDAHDVRYNF